MPDCGPLPDNDLSSKVLIMVRVTRDDEVKCEGKIPTPASQERISANGFYRGGENKRSLPLTINKH